ncbi:cupin domain-containing protein [Egbenema bharatensis]|uniref:cupin domain-containing protein n=1 Tax=Egbenema bharatensis TaxID=3463334 RepID=UPI003A86F76B
MKALSSLLFIGALLFALLIPGLLQAQDNLAAGIVDRGPEQRLLYFPETVEWQAAPPSLEPGAEVALLEGSPSELGVFTMRIRMPDDFYISPHWHPGVERVTAISGLFQLGTGDELNRATTETLEPGSYVSMPPEFRHYAIAEGDTVIQLTSVGPWEVNYINPDDDPRLKA